MNPAALHLANLRACVMFVEGTGARGKQRDMFAKTFMLGATCCALKLEVDLQAEMRLISSGGWKALKAQLLALERVTLNPTHAKQAEDI
jgi:hypothetical protein